MAPKEKKELKGPGVERLIYFDCALSYQTFIVLIQSVPPFVYGAGVIEMEIYKAGRQEAIKSHKQLKEQHDFDEHSY